MEWRAARSGIHRELPKVFSPMQALAALLVTAITTGPVALAAAPVAPPPAVVQVHPNPTRTVADLADRVYRLMAVELRSELARGVPRPRAE